MLPANIDLATGRGIQRGGMCPEARTGGGLPAIIATERRGKGGVVMGGPDATAEGEPRLSVPRVE